MVRDKLVQHHIAKPHEFRWRSREISRIEGLSDAVFGFAVTLLIVALEVPKTSGELLETMRGFISFALTFAILYVLWYRQFVFFRRYALDDAATVALNGALLFVVLFFVFPLKFILGWFVDRLLGGPKTIRLPNGVVERIVRPEHLGPMMSIYGLGTAAVFGIFALLYAHAYRKRKELGLNELEIFDTRLSVEAPTYAAVIGLLTVGQANAVSLAEGKPYEDQVAFATTAVVFAFLAVMLYVTRKRRRQRREMVERIKALGGEEADTETGFQS
jgi:uncharacterized membrane protein